MKLKKITEFSFRDYDYIKLHNMSTQEVYTFISNMSGVNSRIFEYVFKLTKRKNSIKVNMFLEDKPLLEVLVYSTNIIKIVYFNTHPNNEYISFRLFNSWTYTKKKILSVNTINIEIIKFIIQDNTTFKLVPTINKSKFNNHKYDLICNTKLERYIKLNISTIDFFTKLIHYCNGFMLLNQKVNSQNRLAIQIYKNNEDGRINIYTVDSFNSEELFNFKIRVQNDCEKYLLIKSTAWILFTITSDQVKGLSELDALKSIYEYTKLMEA